MERSTFVNTDNLLVDADYITANQKFATRIKNILVRRGNEI
jgi:hypothetical protein